MTVELKAVWHYSERDPEFDCDYYGIELFDSTGEKIAEFGDAYHDKGADRLNGFVKGVEWSTGEDANLVEECVADGMCFVGR